MRKLRALFLRTVGLFRRAGKERDLAAEIESHLQLHIDDNLRAGMSLAEARRVAHLKFGGIDAAKEAWRDQASLPLIETAMQDLRYALRGLRKNLGFTAVAVATLALGIGAITAMFSVVQAVLLRPLPYREPDRLVKLSETNPLKRWTSAPVAPANYADWRRMNTVFTDLGAYLGIDGQGRNFYSLFLTGDGEPRRVRGALVSGSLFDVLGVTPLMGRSFTEEETYEGPNRVAILSYGMWQTELAGDPGMLGRNITLSGRNYTVIGVMPPEFFFPTRETQIYVPLGFKRSRFVEHRRPHYLNVIARLRPGVSLNQAQDQMSAVAARLEQMYPENNTKMGVRLDGFHAALSESKQPALFMLLAAVIVLFLIVCSNVANLQLGRGAARARELRIRQVLGAGRARLIRQLLTESLALSILGGALGVALAYAAQMALVRLAPEAIPRFAELRLDFPVLAFAVLLTAAAPLLFGIVPAFNAARPEALGDRSESAPPSSRVVRNVLVASQVALSVVLVAGAGLLIRSLIRLQQVEPGFTPEQAISFRLTLPSVRYPKDEDALRVVKELERRLREEHGAQAAGVGLVLPLGGIAWTGDATVEGRGNEYERELRRNWVTPDYFRAVGVRLLRGRSFTEGDTDKSPPVTIVNQTLERAYFRGQSAVGKRLKFGRPSDTDPWVTVVGVIADYKQDALDARTFPEAFSPFQQQVNSDFRVVIRGAGTPAQLIADARKALRAVDKDLLPMEMAALPELVRASAGDQRFRTTLLSGFAAAALLLAALGIYGVLAYSVTQRSREIGVRKALGAPAAGLFAMVVRDGMRPVATGAGLGLAGAYGFADVLRTLLFEVQPADPVTFALTAGVLASVALCACAIPATRAMRVDPLVSLREE